MLDYMAEENYDCKSPNLKMGIVFWVIQVGPVKPQGSLTVGEEDRRESEGYMTVEVGQRNVI